MSGKQRNTKDETDVCEILKDIKTSDFFEKIKSKITDEWVCVCL